MNKTLKKLRWKASKALSHIIFRMWFTKEEYARYNTVRAQIQAARKKVGK